MSLNYRAGTISDAEKIKTLAVNTWHKYKTKLTEENWLQLSSNLHNITLYRDLLNNSTSFICESDDKEIVGMAFLVSKGNPTEIFDKDWCYIRFVTVAIEYSGKGIGQRLTQQCLEKAIDNQEEIVALHTSEMMENARHIYSKLGFSIAKELPSNFGTRYWLYTLNLSNKK